MFDVRRALAPYAPLLSKLRLSRSGWPPTPCLSPRAAPHGRTQPAGQRPPRVDLRENRRLVTVLFGDLSGSTTLGERLDPEDLRRILTSFFSVLSREIQRYGGTVDKYIGDAVMAVFGAPVAHEDDAVRAVSAAIAMQAAIGSLNEELDRRYGSRLAMRIGINTGEVVAGLMAGDVQGAYTVVGDTVNTAQRFEAAAEPGTHPGRPSHARADASGLRFRRPCRR